MFLKQFIGKRFWQGILLSLFCFILAVFARGTFFALPILLLVGIFSATITYRKIVNGLLFALLEMMIGGHGHLLEASLGPVPLSLRTVIFAGVLFGWFLLFAQKKVSFSFLWKRDIPWIVFGAALVLGTIVGLVKHPFVDVFDDMNGYLTMLYLFPIISVVWTQESRREWLQVFASGVAWVVLLTLGLSFLFNHAPSTVLKPVYAFVRDARIAEITIQVPNEVRTGWTAALDPIMSGSAGYWYRVFLPDQFFIFVFLLVCLAGMLLQWREQRLPGEVALAVSACVAAGFLSMSRSFFLGFCVAAGFLWVGSFFVGKHATRNVLRRSVFFVLQAAVGVALAWATIVFPYPSRPDLSSASFYQTSKDVGREAGVSSRWNLLGPLNEAIFTSPLIGSGFGTTVTYQTDDPRIKAETGTGEYTTYRFEWGYQDLWLKMGILGLLFAAVYVSLTAKSIKTTLAFHDQDWIVTGLSGGLLLLFVSHTFSPYLNHPIGIIYLLFVIPFFNFSGEWIPASLRMSLPSSVPSVAIRPAISIRTNK